MKKLLLVIVGICCVSSCADHSASKKKEQILRINFRGDPSTLDPRKGGDLISSQIQFLLFEGLTRNNADNTISPAQAESIDISADQKTYTFHLRDCHWSDGSPVTAYDFEKSWKDILDPRFPSLNAHLLYPIKNAEAAKKGELPLNAVGIEAKDAKTFIVELIRPAPYFLQITSFCVLFPVSKSIDHAYPDWAQNIEAHHFVSNGPFKLKSWKHKDEIIVERNDKYWNVDEVHLDKIKISMIDNEMTILHMYENGELDFLDMVWSPIPIAALTQLDQAGHLDIKPIPASTVCFFNTERFPFNNVHIRKAFAYALNRAAIVKNILPLKEVPALEIIPPILKNRRNTPVYQDNDVELARTHLAQGLQELGIKVTDLQDIHFHYKQSEASDKIAQTLQQQWSEALGVKVRLVSCEYASLIYRLSKRDYSLALSQWVAQYFDAMNILERLKSKQTVKNYTNWENKEYARLLDLSHEEVDPEKRFDVLEAAEKILLDDMPLIPIHHWNSAFLLKPYIKNAEILYSGNAEFLKIYIEQ